LAGAAFPRHGKTIVSVRWIGLSEAEFGHVTNVFVLQGSEGFNVIRYGDDF
jgi:hypothetical protein